MKEIPEKEQKKILFDILVSVDDYCFNNGLQYYMTGGTLLGAVRHQGFIPWDDDIDICMPRDDYDKFVKNFSAAEGRYRVVNEDNTESYYIPFAKVVDDYTVLEEQTSDPIKIGVYIDVFPMDYLGNEYAGACSLAKHVTFYRRILSAKTFKNHEKRSVVSNIISNIVYFVPITKIRLIKKINRIASSKQEMLDSKYIGNIVMMCYGEREIAEAKWFSETVKLPFEGKLFNAPKGYDLYLSRIYGDYMELPPKEKRVSHHKLKMWFKDERGVI